MHTYIHTLHMHTNVVRQTTSKCSTCGMTEKGKGKRKGTNVRTITISPGRPFRVRAAPVKALVLHKMLSRTSL